MANAQARNLATVRAFYAAGPSADDADRHPFAVEGIVWHVPGANHVSGRYVGRTAVFETMPKLMQPLDEWDIEVCDLLANGELVVATVRLRARRAALEVDSSGAHLFRLDDDARIVEAWGFVAEQAALDALFDSPL